MRRQEPRATRYPLQDRKPADAWQEGARVRLCAQSPVRRSSSRKEGTPAGRPAPELAGDRPKQRRAPTPQLDRYCAIFFNLDRSLACVYLGPYMVLEISSPSLPSACWRSWYDGVPLWPISGGGAEYTLVCGTSCFTSCPPIQAAHTAWTDGRIHRLQQALSMTSSKVDPAKTRPTQFVAPSVSFRHTPVQRGASTAWTSASTTRHGCGWLILQTGNFPGVRHRP